MINTFRLEVTFKLSEVICQSESASTLTVICDWEICVIPPVTGSIDNRFELLFSSGTSLALICARKALLPEVMTFFQLGIIYGISRLDTVTLPPTSHS